MKQRNQSIDILRGVSIFIIIWSHVCLGWLLDEVVNVSVLGVFFCISGYFYKPLSLKSAERRQTPTLGSRRGAGPLGSVHQPCAASAERRHSCRRTNEILELEVLNTIKKKSAALLKPWLIFSLLGYFYSMIYALLIAHIPFRWDMIPVDLIKGCDFEANIPCWFFICLFEIFIIYSFLQTVSLKVRTIISVFLSIIGAVLLAYDINNLYIGKALFYLLFLHTGYLIKNANTLDVRRQECRRSALANDSLKKKIFIPIGLLAFIALLFVKIRYIDNLYLDFIVGYICAIIIFVVMLALDQPVKNHSKNLLLKFISYVGKNSLTIFALHIITNSIVWRLLYPYFHTPDMALSFIYAIISMLLCLPFIPIYNFLFGPKPKDGELPVPSK